jgi:hypothetical protein
VQAGPDAVYRHGRCPELELTQGFEIIRASTSAAVNMQGAAASQGGGLTAEGRKMP